MFHVKHWFFSKINHLKIQWTKKMKQKFKKLKNSKLQILSNILKILKG